MLQKSTIIIVMVLSILAIIATVGLSDFGANSLGSGGQSKHHKFLGTALLYGFTKNKQIMESLKNQGFSVIEIENNHQIVEIDDVAAIIIDSDALFKTKTLNLTETKYIIDRALDSGKPVAFVSEKGIDMQNLTSLLKEVLKDKPKTLENVLATLGTISYEISYNASGPVIVRSTTQDTNNIQDINYIFILKLIGSKREAPSMYILSGSGKERPEVSDIVYTYLALYLEEVINE